MAEIVNRVASSSLITFDLEEHYPQGKRMELDIAQFLHEGFILMEKDFRSALKNYDWQQYQGAFVAMHCSTDAILPAWANLLIATYLTPVAKKVVLGDLQALEKQLFFDVVEDLNTEEFTDAKMIVKGCSNKQIPSEAYVALIQKLTPVVSSLMYGEACSSVPLYKKPKH